MLFSAPLKLVKNLKANTAAYFERAMFFVCITIKRANSQKRSFGTSSERSER